MLVLAAAVAAHRILVLRLPFFALDSHALENVASGVASDVSLLGMFAIVGGLLARTRAKRVLHFVAPFAALACAAGFAAHYRYMEHFGFTLRPFHLGKMTSVDLFATGAFNVAQSNGSLLILGAAAIAAAFAVYVKTPVAFGGARALAFALALAVSGHAVANGLKGKPYMNRELRFNPLAGLGFTWAEMRRFEAAFKPSSQDLRDLRGLAFGPRAWDEGPANAFPLWQTGIERALPPGPGADAFATLQEFLRAEAEAKGPWNVVLILAESLRAKELDDGPPLFRALPGVLATGIRFTEAYSAGMHTSHGQLASLCSVFNPSSMDLMYTTPRNNLACLGEIFRAQTYETLFFYGSDNAFDNQATFHAANGMSHIFGESQFALETPRAGWGVSDHALFDYAVERTKTANQPFFSTILSLSNHRPYRLPTDVPAGLVDSSASRADQILQYVDWSLAALLQRIERELPHTLVVLVADHGIPRGEALAGEAAFGAMFRTITRVPFWIRASGMPEALAGTRLGHLASVADVPPTVLALLGRYDVPNQFMGRNAFAAREEVLINWQNRLYAYSGTLRPIERRQEQVLSSLVLGDLLAPRSGGSRFETGRD